MASTGKMSHLPWNLLIPDVLPTWLQGPKRLSEKEKEWPHVADAILVEAKRVKIEREASESQPPARPAVPSMKIPSLNPPVGGSTAAPASIPKLSAIPKLSGLGGASKLTSVPTLAFGNLGNLDVAEKRVSQCISMHFHYSHQIVIICSQR